jgi:hypothetical protein
MEYTKFKQSDLPIIRRKLIAMQNGLCPVCGKDLTRTSNRNLVVDHDHDTGIVRAVMHRGCNGVEGKVKRLVSTWGKAKGIEQVILTLERLITFWRLHQTPQTEWIYYNHKTAAEKRAAYNKKRRKVAAAKRKETK